MKTCPCNEDTLTPHFYIVKLGFTGVYIIFSFLLRLKHILIVGTRKNRLSEAVLTCTHNQCFEPKNEIYNIFSSENYRFYSREILQYIAQASFRNGYSFLSKVTLTY